MRNALSTRIQLTSENIDEFEDDRLKALQARLRSHASMGAPTPKRWLCDGFLGAGELSVAYGPPGSTKTAFAVDLACRLAAGINWSGEESDGREGVLYIAAERAGQVRRRVDAFCMSHGIPPLDNLIVYDGELDLADAGNTLADIADLARMTCWPDDGDPIEIGLIIIDTLSAAMSGSDASPEVMAAAVRSIRTAMRAEYSDSACLVVHHTPANGEARMRGAGQLLGAADTTISISHKRGVGTAQVVKNNDSEERLALSYSLISMETAPNTTAAVVVPIFDAAAKAKPVQSARLPAALRRATTVLSEAVRTNGGPVTIEEWRAASDAAAGEISEEAKRKRFDRMRVALADSPLFVEDSGRFSLVPDNDNSGQNRTFVQN